MSVIPLRSAQLAHRRRCKVFEKCLCSFRFSRSAVSEWPVRTARIQGVPSVVTVRFSLIVYGLYILPVHSDPYIFATCQTGTSRRNHFPYILYIHQSGENGQTGNFLPKPSDLEPRTPPRVDDAVRSCRVGGGRDDVSSLTVCPPVQSQRAAVTSRRYMSGWETIT